jgi:glucose dehydrogenase/cytochrome c5
MAYKRPLLAFGLAIGVTVLTFAQNDWKTYGNDPGHTKFSTLTQITPQNVMRLTKAWEFDTKTPGRKWQNTPVVINNIMYITLQNGGVVALEPETGRELWRFETPVRGRSVRAIAYWPGDDDTAPRLLYGANDKLLELDPITGRLIESFGNKGVLDVHPGQPAGAAPPARGAAIDSDEGGQRGGGRGGGPGGPGRGGRGGREGGAPFGSGFSISSPPAIYKNLAILGGSEGENAVVGPAGDPQAFDVKTGKLVWRFHVVPHPGERNAGTWGEGWKDRGGPAIWGFMTVDTERGMVFIPTGNPGGSFYGGDRPGDNLYATSVVALDAATGAYKWHYQTTRHDVFDADLAAAPALVDVVHNGRRIPAVAQVTKMGGMLFILDRLTGKPIYPVEERKVPISKVPGEGSAPTQPFPTKPAPWSRLGMTKADITTVTPESNKFCTEWWEKDHLYNDGPYTSYGTDGVTVVFSGTIGGGNWGGVAYNPQLGYVFVNTSSLATVGHMVPGTGLEKYRNELSYTRFWDNNKYPCQQPPWGELVAVNVNTGEIAWKIPFGIYPELVAKGIPPTGTPNLGGPIATASGLVFIGATKDARFRAYDAKTGKELWYTQLEAAGGATPMTFMGRNGIQYVVIAAGGPGDTDRGGSETYPQKLVAFALGDRVQTMTAPAAALAAAHANTPPAAASRPQTLATPVSAERLEQGRQLTEKFCTTCHGMESETAGGKTADGWKATVEAMVGMGAEADEEQARIITDYLSHTFPPKK